MTTTPHTTTPFVFPGSAQRHPPQPPHRYDSFYHHHHHNSNDSATTVVNNTNSTNNRTSPSIVENPLLRNLRTPLASIQPSRDDSSNHPQQPHHPISSFTTTPKSAGSSTSSLIPFSPFSPPPPSLFQLRSHKNVQATTRTSIDDDLDAATAADQHLLSSLFHHQDHPESLGLRQRHVKTTTQLLAQNKRNDENWTMHHPHKYHHHHHPPTQQYDGDSSKKKNKPDLTMNMDYEIPKATQTSSSYSLGNVPTLLTFALPNQQHPSQFRYQTGTAVTKPTHRDGPSFSTTNTTPSTMDDNAVSSTILLISHPPSRWSEQRETDEKRNVLSNESRSNHNHSNTEVVVSSTLLTENDILLFRSNDISMTSSPFKMMILGTPRSVSVNVTHENDILLSTTTTTTLPSTAHTGGTSNSNSTTENETERTISYCERMVRYMFAMDE